MRKRLTPRKAFWAVVACGYLLFFMFGGCADKLLLFPQRGHVDAAQADRKLIPFEGGQLEVLVARSPGAATRPVEGYVVSFVGNAARAEYTAVADAIDWGDRPVEVWTVNHPGFGASTGPATLKRLAAAALVSFDALSKEAGGKPVLVSGVSMGTTMALHVAANRKVAGAMLRSPPPLRSLILGKYGWWNLWLAAVPVSLGVPAELDSLSNAKTVTAPAVFILTDTDEVVPLKYQQMVYDAYAGEKRAVTNRGGMHNDPLNRSAREALVEAQAWLGDAAFGRK